MSNQSTKERIQNDLVKFMKSGEKDKVEIIRFAQSFIKQLEKDKNIELSEIETIQVLKKVIKRNQESYDQFIKAGRDELAAQEKKEMDIIKSYLPEEMSETDAWKLQSKLAHAYIKDKMGMRIKDLKLIETRI